MLTRNDLGQRHHKRALRLTIRLGALLLAYYAIGAWAAHRKDPPGVHATPTGFTIVETAKIDGKSRDDYSRAVELFAQEKYPEGIAILESVAAKSPQFTAAFVDLGIAYGKNNQWDKADVALHKAVELQPQHPVAWNELGLVQRHEGKFKDARESFGKSLAAAPGFHYARLNLAVLCDLYLDDAQCALDNYLAYQQIVPDDKKVAGWIKNAQSRLGKKEAQQ